MSIKYEGHLYWFIHELPFRATDGVRQGLAYAGTFFGLLTALLYLTTDWFSIITLCAICTILLPATSILLEIAVWWSVKYIKRNKPSYMGGQ